MTCVVLSQITLKGISEPLEAAGRALREQINCLSEMECWIKEQGSGGKVYLDYDMLEGCHVVTLGFEFEIPNEAFWFKMAWVA